MKKILVAAGTRPNFIKITQFKKEASRYPHLDLRIIHTGQHYDSNLSHIFFEQFGMHPDHTLDIIATTPEKQIDEIKEKLMAFCRNTFSPDLFIVPGDVNATLAAAEAAAALDIPLAHLESGLRSFDETMPEEYNRIRTDELSNYHFVTEKSGTDNLLKAGFSGDNIFFTGNTMIDTIVAYNDQIHHDPILSSLGVEENHFVLATIHRPSNVDTKINLEQNLELITAITANHDMILPMHPRTKKKLEEFRLDDHIKKIKRLIITEPLGYFAFQKLISTCKFIITDSGGIQEEATFRKKPCLTIRPNTERPSTVLTGSNTLVPLDIDKINLLVQQIDNGNYKKGGIPELWDGMATKRVFEVLQTILPAH